MKSHESSPRLFLGVQKREKASKAVEMICNASMQPGSPESSLNIDVTNRGATA